MEGFSSLKTQILKHILQFVVLHILIVITQGREGFISFSNSCVQLFQILIFNFIQLRTMCLWYPFSVFYPRILFLSFLFYLILVCLIASSNCLFLVLINPITP